MSVRYLLPGPLSICVAGLTGCSVLVDFDQFEAEPKEVALAASVEGSVDDGSTDEGADAPSETKPPGSEMPGTDDPSTDGSMPGEPSNTVSSPEEPGEAVSPDTGMPGPLPSPPPAEEPGCVEQLIEFDDIYELMQTDILTQDVEDRSFTRYVLLTDRYNQGICAGDPLDRDRFGMNKMLNMLSTELRVSQAFPVNGDETIYRIDIRDYGWNRQVTVNGVAFNDGWEAIVGANAYALEFDGDEAEAVIRAAETNVPWQYSDSMVSVATVGELYYALIDVDVGVSLDDFILTDLGINVNDKFDQLAVVRAGTSQPAASREGLVAERFDIEARPGVFWQTFDLEEENSSSSVFEDPIDAASGSGLAIFTLPNGFLAYMATDETRAVVTQLVPRLVSLQGDFTLPLSVACSGCHAQGFVSVVDEVRGVVEQNRFNYNADDFLAVQAIYPIPVEFAEVVAGDSAALQRSLAEAGLPTTGPDPVQEVFLRFGQDLTRVQVAGELGISVAALEMNIGLFDPSLEVVDRGAGVLAREDFSAQFAASLCVAQSFSQNQPLGCI